jgi:toxin-antitoxin system PIN domain toxin
MTVLLDSSVAIALLTDEHEHFDASRRWFRALSDRYATCPMTQGAVVRYALRRGRSATGAMQSLNSLISNDRHDFWPDDVEFPAVRLAGVVGHSQVTDAYLAELARKRSGRVATLDQGMASLHDDVAELVPTS